MTLADIFGLIFIEDKGSVYSIESFGFIKQDHALRLIFESPKESNGMPYCYLKSFDSYKIGKHILARFPFNW